MNFKKNDTVQVLAGKDKGKTGKVVNVNSKTGLITVEGVNIRIRHERPKQQGKKGQKISTPYPMTAGKLMLVCPVCGKLTRVAHSKNDAGVKMRQCKKCKNTF